MGLYRLKVDVDILSAVMNYLEDVLRSDVFVRAKVNSNGQVPQCLHYAVLAVAPLWGYSKGLGNPILWTICSFNGSYTVRTYAL